MKNQTDEPMGGLGAQIMMASELGSAIVVLTVLGYFAGAWMDGRFQSSPYGVIVGISIGFGLGIAFVIKRSNDMDKKRWTSLGWRCQSFLPIIKAFAGANLAKAYLLLFEATSPWLSGEIWRRNQVEKPTEAKLQNFYMTYL